MGICQNNFDATPVYYVSCMLLPFICFWRHLVCWKTDVMHPTKFVHPTLNPTYLDFLLSLGSLMANMWTVPLSLEQQRNAESRLKLILKIMFWKTQIWKTCNREILSHIHQYIHFVDIPGNTCSFMHKSNWLALWTTGQILDKLLYHTHGEM